MTDNQYVELITEQVKTRSELNCLNETLKAFMELMINKRESKKEIPDNKKWISAEEICTLTGFEYSTIKKKKKKWGLVFRESGRTLAFRLDTVNAFIKSRELNVIETEKNRK